MLVEYVSNQILIMHYSKKDINEMGKVERLNLINSVSGIKPANLIGTISNDGMPNLAIFSSVIHLGSNPALLGFVVRPHTDVRRHTYENIMENGYYTINHVTSVITEQAHFTSVKFDRDISEFEKCNLTEEYLFNFMAPFVKECKLKIGLQIVESIPIALNNTVLVVGEIHHIVFPDSEIHEHGHLDLSKLENVGISGLNSYYKLEKMAQYPYARLSNLPEFLSDE